MAQSVDNFDPKNNLKFLGWRRENTGMATISNQPTSNPTPCDVTPTSWGIFPVDSHGQISVSSRTCPLDAIPHHDDITWCSAWVYAATAVIQIDN